MQDEDLNTIIDQLKTLVYYDTGGYIVFNHEYAIVVMLLDNVLFTHTHWWMEEIAGWNKDECDTISLNVNSSGVFGWGFFEPEKIANTEKIKYDDIEGLYEHWEKDRKYGKTIWCCKKANMMPQKPVADAIRKAGIWDIDAMGLEPNPTDKCFNKGFSFNQWFRNVHKLNDLENGKIMDISFAKYLEPVLDGYITEPVTMIDNAPVLMKTEHIRHIYEFKQYLSSSDISAYLYTAVLNDDASVTVQYGVRYDCIGTQKMTGPTGQIFSLKLCKSYDTPDSRLNDDAAQEP